jgi:hypothetical protein
VCGGGVSGGGGGVVVCVVVGAPIVVGGHVTMWFHGHVQVPVAPVAAIACARANCTIAAPSVLDSCGRLTCGVSDRRNSTVVLWCMCARNSDIKPCLLTSLTGRAAARMLCWQTSAATLPDLSVALWSGCYVSMLARLYTASACTTTSIIRCCHPLLLPQVDCVPADLHTAQHQHDRSTAWPGQSHLPNAWI